MDEDFGLGNCSSAAVLWDFLGIFSGFLDSDKSDCCGLSFHFDA